MIKISEIVYNSLIAFYGIAIQIASVFNRKARIRSGLNAYETLNITPTGGKLKVWIHVSSLGEYEQALPVIQHLSDNPLYFIVLTVYSPSGFENINTSPAHKKIYLRHDSVKNARDFAQTYSPDLAIMVKYDIWYNHLTEVSRRKCHVIIISALYDKKPWYFRGFASQMNFHEILTQIFVQDENSKDILAQCNFYDTTISGDTRIDRASELPMETYSNSLIEDFIQSFDHIIVWGSIWQKDLILATKIIPELNDRRTGHILVPHDISKNSISNTVAELKKINVSYSIYSQKFLTPESTAIIIDNIGHLKYLYRYADFAFIGGGWKSGIHNTLEAAVYGLPMAFGPNYDKFKEAKDFIKIGAAESVQTQQQLLIMYLKSIENSDLIRKKLDKYFQKHRGATHKITRFIDQILAK